MCTCTQYPHTMPALTVDMCLSTRSPWWAATRSPWWAATRTPWWAATRPPWWEATRSPWWAARRPHSTADTTISVSVHTVTPFSPSPFPPSLSPSPPPPTHTHTPFFPHLSSSSQIICSSKHVLWLQKSKLLIQCAQGEGPANIYIVYTNC